VINQGENGREKNKRFCEEERKKERELFPSEFSLLSSGPLCDDDAVVVIHTSKSCSLLLLLFLLCSSNVSACSNLHPFVSSAPSCIWKTLSPMQQHPPPPPPPLLAAAACCCCKTDKNLYLYLSFFVFRCPSVLQMPHPLHVQPKTVFFFFFSAVGMSVCLCYKSNTRDCERDVNQIFFPSLLLLRPHKNFFDIWKQSSNDPYYFGAKNRISSSSSSSSGVCLCVLQMEHTIL
jgi:hypothetical protein